MMKRSSPVVTEPLLNLKRPRDPERTKQRNAEEDALWARYRAEPTIENRNALWLFFASLVKYIAERIKCRVPECVEAEDLKAQGYVGLVQAIETFKPEMGFRFATFATARIRGSILDYLRGLSWMPRLERWRKNTYASALENLRIDLKREPEPEEVAMALGWNEAELDQALRGEHFIRTVEAEEAFYDLLLNYEDLRAVDPIEAIHLPDESALRFVPRGIERDVCRMYYFEDLSMNQIDKRLKLSESRICQIHTSAMANARRAARLSEQEAEHRRQNHGNRCAMQGDGQGRARAFA